MLHVNAICFQQLQRAADCCCKRTKAALCQVHAALECGQLMQAAQMSEALLPQSLTALQDTQSMDWALYSNCIQTVFKLFSNCIQTVFKLYAAWFG
jgi:hypothetical protein